jgi:tRNA threonylcarbamoyladenosine biosynthesis protein TsaE
MEFEDAITNSSEETRALAKALASHLVSGDVILLEGELGAGKTTFVRGLLEGLGHEGPVRSPTFNLLQVFDTDPPVLHADLYRLSDASSVGLEDYLDSHICLIEWPDAASGVLAGIPKWKISFRFEGEGRRISMRRAADMK